MKLKILFFFLIGLLCFEFSFSQNTPIPSGSFNVASDVDDWTILPNTVSKSWFDGGCQSMFVDNLPNTQTAIITSPLFNIGSPGDYELELEYGVIYSTTAAVFELLDDNSTVLSASTNNTITGTCADWPNPKKTTLVFSNLSSGDYQLRITIPKSQFFIDGVSLGITNTLSVTNYKLKEALIISPNPTNGSLLMNLNYSGNYSLFNINGQLLQNGSLNIGENILDISNLPSGLYLIKTTTLEGKTFTNKVLKK
ncbi:T9SS type A sorting domain-containing protein [Psychroserpens sp. NJDZ02]|uniref:T9SS type A sorting domain-containing protein n=1 Tax=Psychroserpens sp. NJDZ02 TaxID=2570561 RepID=UPI0010A835E3|nr:T9SS type A sorting domain-containing protein [Psychroserpens sp. NJDZ02]QCE42065.1 T9SS type A sorting domain-containing protein [Psychroserpens sp. NJDZ02]